MRKILSIILLLSMLHTLVLPASAMDFTAPAAPNDVQKYMPEDTASFADGLWYVVRTTLASIKPDFMESVRSCIMIVAITLMLAIAGSISKVSEKVVCLLTAVSLGMVMLSSGKTFINIGIDTIERVGDYGKLLFPVLTAAAAANGAPTSAAALHVGTLIFISILSGILSSCIVPLIYIYMALSFADCALHNDAFCELKKFVKWLTTWSIKIVLYIFTGYMGVTGAISGSVDSAALKATKLTISGAVPVVGGILADASESILVSAGILKNAAGLYGFFAIVAICLGPFLKIGLQYWLLKLTTSICGIFAHKKAVSLLGEMSSTMGLVLAMTGSICLLLLISVVCFIRSGVL